MLYRLLCLVSPQKWHSTSGGGGAVGAGAVVGVGAAEGSARGGVDGKAGAVAVVVGDVGCV